MTDFNIINLLREAVALAGDGVFHHLMIENMMQCIIS